MGADLRTVICMIYDVFPSQVSVTFTQRALMCEAEYLPEDELRLDTCLLQSKLLPHLKPQERDADRDAAAAAAGGRNNPGSHAMTV